MRVSYLKTSASNSHTSIIQRLRRGGIPKQQYVLTHTLFSTTPPQQVTCDSLFEEIVSTQIHPTNISYYGLQGFSLKNNLNRGVKSLVPLGKKRVGPNPIPCAATTELKPECDRKGLCFYGFTWNVWCNKGLFSS